MLGVGERAQIHPDLRHNRPRRLAVDSRNRQQALNRFLEPTHPPLDLLLQPLDLPLQPLHLPQFFLQQPALLVSEGALQRQL